MTGDRPNLPGVLGSEGENAAQIRTPADDEVDVAALATKANAVANDCCGNDAWRGHFCQYHQGFEDGYDAALLAVRPLGSDRRTPSSRRKQSDDIQAGGDALS